MRELSQVVQDQVLRLERILQWSVELFSQRSCGTDRDRPSTVSKDFIAQTGDPTATGKGGESFASAYYSRLPDAEKRGRPAPPRYIAPEIKTSLKHTARGTVSMAVAPTGTSDKGGCGSQFFITLADNIEYLDGKHSVFGHVVEGFDVLDKLNDAYVDMEGRPLKDVRIRHIEILGAPRLGAFHYTSR